MYEELIGHTIKKVIPLRLKGSKHSMFNASLQIEFEEGVQPILIIGGQIAVFGIDDVDMDIYEPVPE